MTKNTDLQSFFSLNTNARQHNAAYVLNDIFSLVDNTDTNFASFRLQSNLVDFVFFCLFLFTSTLCFVHNFIFIFKYIEVRIDELSPCVAVTC